MWVYISIAPVRKKEDTAVAFADALSTLANLYLQEGAATICVHLCLPMVQGGSNLVTHVLPSTGCAYAIWSYFGLIRDGLIMSTLISAVLSTSIFCICI